MKIVIAGAGEVGTHLAKLLEADYHDLVIVDEDENRIAQLDESPGVLAIVGNPCSIKVLTDAEVDKADLFIAVSPAKDQAVNIISALLAKKIGAKKVAARINNAEYLTPSNRTIFTDLGVDLLFYPEKIAAMEIVDLIKQSTTSEFVSFGNGKLQLLMFRLDEGAVLIDKSPADLNFEVDNLPFRVVAISRDGETIIPRGSTKFRLNDLVFVISKRENVKEAMAYSGKNHLDIRRLMILGGGNIGEMVAKNLENSASFIKLIEINRERCYELSENLDKVLVINGDGRNSDMLIDEEVETFDAFIAVTSSSETNIMASVAAKKLGVSKVIAEVENLEYIKLAEGMGVDSIINKKLVTASRIVKLTLSSKVRTIKVLNGIEADALEYVATKNSKITKGKLRDIKFPKNALIGGVIRGEESFIAVGDTEIKPYDKVAVFALPSAISQVDKFF